MYVQWKKHVNYDVLSGVETGGSGSSMNRGPELLGPRVVRPQFF